MPGEEFVKEFTTPFSEAVRFGIDAFPGWCYPLPGQTNREWRAWFRGRDMKKLVWIIILGLVGYFVYTQYFGPLSDEEKEVKALARRFSAAQSQYLGALRQMGSLGLDATSNADDAIGAMKKVKKELLELKDRLAEADAIERAENLEAGIDEFFAKNDIK